MQTTALQRFTEFLEFTCTHKPPLLLISAWFDGTSDELQSWVMDNMRAPLCNWAQAIVLIDAATLLANVPQECCDIDGEPQHFGQMQQH